MPCEAGLAPYDVMYLIFWVLVVGLAHGSSVLASEHDRDKHHRGASSKYVGFVANHARHNRPTTTTKGDSLPVRPVRSAVCFHLCAAVLPALWCVAS